MIPLLLSLKNFMCYGSNVPELNLETYMSPAYLEITDTVKQQYLIQLPGFCGVSLEQGHKMN